MSRKRLLISIPSGVGGNYSMELAWWLTAIQVSSTVQDFGDEIAEKMSDIGQRMMVRAAAKKMGVAWSLEQASLQWSDPRKVKDITKPLIPDGWSVSMAPVLGGPIACVRNEQVRRFLFSKDHDSGDLVSTDFDAALFIDTDNVPGRHDLHPLLEAIERDDVDVVGGVYCMEHSMGPQPIIYRLTETGEGFEYDTKTAILPRGLHRLEKGGLPGGCLLVKRRVFEKLWEARRVWFKDCLHDASLEYYEVHALMQEHRDDPLAFQNAVRDLLDSKGDQWGVGQIGSWRIGEDIHFCKMCHDLGIDVWVDTRVFLKHMKVADNKQTFFRQEAVGRKFFKLGVKHAKPDATPEEQDAAYGAHVTRRVSEQEEASGRGRRKEVIRNA